MGASDSVFFLSNRGQKNYLYDQRHRELAYALRKIIKNRGHFPNDDAAVKLLYLALKNITKDWKMSAREWKSAMNQFAILFADRFMRNLHYQFASHTQNFGQAR